MNKDQDRSARVIAVTSGKGGVGKTNISVNLAAALAAMGQRSLLVDCDPGQANANILMGRKGGLTISDLLGRQCALDDALQDGPGGMKFLPGHSGTGIGSALGASERESLARALRPHAEQFDAVIVDTASGIGDDLLDLVATSDAVLIVLTPEPTSFMDAYALVKALAMKQGCTRVLVATNMVSSDLAGQELFDHFRDVIRQFLKIEPVHVGAIPEDPNVRRSVFRKTICLEAFPSARASRAYANMARALTKQLPPDTEGGRRFFAMELCHGI